MEFISGVLIGAITAILGYIALDDHFEKERMIKMNNFKTGDRVYVKNGDAYAPTRVGNCGTIASVVASHGVSQTVEVDFDHYDQARNKSNILYVCAEDLVLIITGQKVVRALLDGETLRPVRSGVLSAKRRYKIQDEEFRYYDHLLAKWRRSTKEINEMLEGEFIICDEVCDFGLGRYVTKKDTTSAWEIHRVLSTDKCFEIQNANGAIRLDVADRYRHATEVEGKLFEALKARTEELASNNEQTWYEGDHD